jgi:hypothetical protein
MLTVTLTSDKKNPIICYIQMNFQIWIYLKNNQAITELYACNSITKKGERRCKYFTSDIFIGWLRVHLDMTPYQVLSDFSRRVVYYNS